MSDSWYAGNIDHFDPECRCLSTIRCPLRYVTGTIAWFCLSVTLVPRPVSCVVLAGLAPNRVTRRVTVGFVVPCRKLAAASRSTVSHRGREGWGRREYLSRRRMRRRFIDDPGAPR